MRRIVVCAGVGLLLVAGSLFAAQRQGAPAQSPEFKGKIVKMDNLRGILTIQLVQGTNVFENNFQVRGNTKFYGYNNVGIIEGLRNTNFRPGADVYFRLFPAPNKNLSLSELRVGPTVP